MMTSAFFLEKFCRKNLWKMLVLFLILYYHLLTRVKNMRLEYGLIKFCRQAKNKFFAKYSFKLFDRK